MTDLILLKYGRKLDEEAELLFGFIRDSAVRLRNLLAGLKTHMEIMESGGPYCRCRAEDLLRGAIASLQPKVDEAGATVTHGALPELDCDPKQITFLFASLIDNAIKFRGKEAPRIHISAASAGNGWIISVRDNGIGIDSRHHQSIFDVFKRVYNDQYPGAGMGLAITMGIVQRHDGNIRVESVPGEGTTVIIEFPNQASQ
jgi:light-regulated signal transduction histidine kinase (bacteriophytochrome)